MTDGTRITGVRDGDALRGGTGTAPRDRMWPMSDSTFIVENQGIGVRFGPPRDRPPAPI
jgi:hypothetical protein